ncbi:peptidyl-tRNA hydrolase [Azospirillum sp. TSH100]|uniref:aminoacyl-tRNA hydrolase n=1 Tax=Azospirillum sp. TSH100 TaxID=652764 RepID=UPI000D61C18C|nr:aminoacyl-tRNA hydrolase [Azospirillum sp. TSH100]PWC86622.1 peptidyl-tRNA hydrolase [Azospirillum sp. TSH100]QCG86285.1 aminoacyl-tRNA hydrolase [Azospirillum sp. TSH100]
MLLLVGLGNPGNEYARNRHNIGFMAVETIAQRHRFTPWKKRFQGQTAEGTVAGDKVLALEPATFMNLSGQSVVAALQFFKLKPENVVVIHDELDLPPGKIRVKKGGGHGGHNGLRSIDAHIGKDYWRVRLGIGHPGNKDLVSGYVLHDFAKADQSWIDPLLDAVSDNLPLIVDGQPELFMNKVTVATQGK